MSRHLAIVISWPDHFERRTVTRRHDGEVLGFIRSADGRYFAEDSDLFPIEGTFRTRWAALDALLDTLPSGGRA